jgi:hypothetical protein
LKTPRSESKTPKPQNPKTPVHRGCRRLRNRKHINYNRLSADWERISAPFLFLGWLDLHRDEGWHAEFAIILYAFEFLRILLLLL